MRKINVNMKTVALLALALIVAITTTGCLGSKAHKPTLVTLEGGKEVYFGWVDQRKLPSDAYWVLLEPVRDGEYKILNISTIPLYVDIRKRQEQLYVDKNFKYVQPFFTAYDDTIAVIKNYWGPGQHKTVHRGTWECQALGKYTSYSPCTSSLTRVDTAKTIGKNIFAIPLTLGLMTGTHRAVDTEKVKSIVTELDIFSAIDQWRKDHAQRSK